MGRGTRSDSLDAYIQAFFDKIGSSERRHVQLYLPIGLWQGLENAAQHEAITVGGLVSDELRDIARVLRRVPADRQGAWARWARVNARRWTSGEEEKFRECRKVWAALPPEMWEIFETYSRAWGQSLDRTLSRFLSASVKVAQARANVLRQAREERAGIFGADPDEEPLDQIPDVEDNLHEIGSSEESEADGHIS